MYRKLSVHWLKQQTKPSSNLVILFSIQYEWMEKAPSTQPLATSLLWPLGAGSGDLPGISNAKLSLSLCFRLSYCCYHS